MKIMQGDAYAIPFAIDVDGTPVTDTMVEKVEIVIGEYMKEYPGAVKYQDGEFLYPISQEESFSMQSCVRAVQIRVKFNTGDVVGVRLPDIDVAHSMSKAVL